MVKGWGKTFLDVTANLTLHGDNTDFGATSAKRQQDILWGFETHLSRNLTKRCYVGVGALWQWGGESQVNGTDQDDEQRKTSLQIMLSHKMAPKHRLALYYKQDVEIENGFKMNTFSLRYNHVF